MSFKISYAANEETSFKTLTLKEKIFGSDWDADRIEEEIKEYVYNDIENRGISLDEDAVIYKDIEKVVKKLKTISKMKTTTESLKASDLSIGQKVKYGLFTVTFMGIDERNHVLLKDSDGEVRNIFLELFETHAKIA